MFPSQDNHEQPEPDDHQFRVLVNAVAFMANEPLVLAQYEATAQPGDFAQLYQEGDGEEFSKRVNRVVDHLGGPPEC